MTDKFQEKRREPRLKSQGRLVLNNPESGPGSRIEGELVDVSVHGFRAAHSGRYLAAGQELTFEHAHASGRAKVVWTRIAGSTVESGFVIVKD